MSQKVGQLSVYAINQGDSPADLLNISEDQENYQQSYLQMTKQHLSQSQQQSQPPQAQTFKTTNPLRHSLSTMMNGKTPREFANEQVYGKKSRESSLHSENPQRKHTSNQWLQLQQESQQQDNQKYMQGSQTQSQQLPQSSQQSSSSDPFFSQQFGKSMYTIRSEALMRDLLDNKQFPVKTKETLALGADQMTLFTRTLSQQPSEDQPFHHRRQKTVQERELIERLFYDKQNEEKKNETIQRIKQEQLAECTFSPRILGSFQAGQGSSYSSSSVPRKIQSTREITVYEQSKKKQLEYANNLNILREQKQAQETTQILSKPAISKANYSLSQTAFSKKGMEDLTVTQRLTQKTLQQQHKSHQELENYPFRPEISEYAAQKQRTTTVQDDLYQDAQKRREQKKQNQSIGSTNGSRNIQSVYESSSSGSSQQSSQSSTQQHHVTATQKRNHQKNLQNCFTREFIQAVVFSGDNHNNNSSIPISSSNSATCPLSAANELVSLSQTKLILFHLGFLKESPQTESEFLRIWRQVSHNSSNNTIKTTIPTRNLLVFLLAVQNLQYDDCQATSTASGIIQGVSWNSSHQTSTAHPVDPAQSNINTYQSQISSQEAVGTFDSSGILNLDNQQVEQIHFLFKPLYDTLLTSQRINRARASRNAIPLPSFAPMISQRSSRLAEDKRNRVLSSMNSDCGYQVTQPQSVINDICTYERELTLMKTEHLREQLNNERQLECTFHPQTKEFKRSKSKHSSSSYSASSQYQKQQQSSDGNTASQNRSTSQAGIDKSFQLFSLAKPSMQRRDRTKLEIEYEKECDQCTFTPAISNPPRQTSSSVIAKKQQQSQSESQELSSANTIFLARDVHRQQSGRVEREVRQRIKQSGHAVSNKQRLNMQRQVFIDLLKNEAKQKEETQMLPKKPKLPQNFHVELVKQQQQHNINKSYGDQSINCNKSQVGSDRNVKIEQIIQEQQQQQQQVLISQQQQSSAAMEYLESLKETSEKWMKAKSIVEEDKVPLLFVDVNIEDGKTARIVVYEGEKSEDLAEKFAKEYGLEQTMKSRLKDLLDQQINSLLTKIVEEVGSDHEDDDYDDDDDDEDQEEDNEEEQPYSRNGSYNRRKPSSNNRFSQPQQQPTNQIQDSHEVQQYQQEELKDYVLQDKSDNNNRNSHSSINSTDKRTNEQSPQEQKQQSSSTSLVTEIIPIAPFSHPTNQQYQQYHPTAIIPESSSSVLNSTKTLGIIDKPAALIKQSSSSSYSFHSYKNAYNHNNLLLQQSNTQTFKSASQSSLAYPSQSSSNEPQ